jgi:hypothetical protein
VEVRVEQDADEAEVDDPVELRESDVDRLVRDERQ